MRRWILLLLLCVLPLQLVWAAAAPYCAHEGSASTKKHFGHHDHQHKGGTQAGHDDGDGDSQGGGGTNHVDCESCHLGSSGTVLTLMLSFDAAPRAPAVSRPGPHDTSYIPSGPERPDRGDRPAAARFGGGVAVGPITA